jgi:hypothetical protein
VSRRILVALLAIEAGADNHAIAHRYSAHRHLAQLSRPGSLFQSRTHPPFVYVKHTQFLHHLSHIW